MVDERNEGKDLASRLRQQLGQEAVEEAAEDERLTEDLRQRKLDLLAVVEDAAHRGDRATAEFDDKAMSGPIVATGLDYATVRLAEQDAEVVLSGAVWSFVNAPTRDTESRTTAMSMRARLDEHRAEENRIRLELAGGAALMGVIRSVSEDHIRVEDADGRVVYVPMESLRAVIRSISQR
jgi:hypothetical protein